MVTASDWYSFEIFIDHVVGLTENIVIIGVTGSRRAARFDQRRTNNSYTKWKMEANHIFDGHNLSTIMRSENKDEK